MRIFTFSLILFSTFLVNAQTPIDIRCYSDMVQFNKLRIPVNKYAGWLDVARNECSSSPFDNYGVDLDSNGTINQASLLIYGGRTPSGPGGTNCYAIDMYGFEIVNGEIEKAFNGVGGLRMGPYSPYSSSEELNWQKYWTLTKWDIDYHIANYMNPGYSIHPDIASWPAHGDTSKGENYLLAPFYDFNNNDIYEPYNGDYPLIKGSKCVYMIMNDIQEGTGPTQLVYQLNIEIHKMIYSMDCLQDSSLNYSLFVETKIINKFPSTIDNLFIGTSLDFDIGYSYDDYVGTDIMRNLAYAYNGDQYDEDGFGYSGYGNFIPAQGYTILRGMKKEDNGIDDGITHFVNGSFNGTGFNDGIIDNEYLGLTSSMTASSSAFTNFNNYYQCSLIDALWYSGEPLTYGGDGHVYNTTTHPTKFCFPGDSDPLHYATGNFNPSSLIWSEDVAGTAPGDRKLVAGTRGGRIPPNEEAVVTSVYTYARDFTTPGSLASVSKLKSFVDDLHNYFDANQTPCGQTFDYYYAHNYLDINQNENLGLVEVFPNPSKGIFNIKIPKLESASIRIYDLKGQLIFEKNNQKEQFEVNINTFQKGIYILKIELETGQVIRKIVKQ